MSKSTNKGKEKTLHEKVKQFFGIRGSSPLTVDYKTKSEPFAPTNEILKDISTESPINHRLKSMRDLFEVVLMKRLEQNAVEALCLKTIDMLHPQYAAEVRHTVLQFYSCIIQGQMESMSIMRSYFFKLIRTHTLPEDAVPRLEMLKALSENGKSITYFEEEIGPFLLEWIPDIIGIGKANDLLLILVNIIKCNAAYLDEEIIAGFVQNTCTLCGRTDNEEDIQICLDLFDAIICYSHLPSPVLPLFIVALCKTVNIERFSQVSWKVMRNLLGTSTGHSSIFIMCCFLQDRANLKAVTLLRGAVFFVGMALWGSKKVPSLIHPPTAVLPSFLQALDSNSNIVAYEIALSLQRLVKKNAEQMQALTWDIILDIIERILKYPELQHTNQPMSPLALSIHDLITITEEQYEKGVFRFSPDRLFNIIESCSDSRSEESIIHLIQYQTQFLQSTKEDLITNLNHLLAKYFKNETRQAIQLKVLNVLYYVLCTSGHLFEDDLIDQTVLQYMLHLDMVDISVRKAAIDLLIELAENCVTKRFFDILDIIEKVMKYYFDCMDQEDCDLTSTALVTSKDISDIKTAVFGLIKVFKKKLHILPSNHAVRIYNILINHIQSHYKHSLIAEEGNEIRRMIIEFILKLRTNPQKQIGIAENKEEIQYSVYIMCSSSDSSDGPTGAILSPPPGSPIFPSCTISYLNFSDAFHVLITCLKQEKDWRVMKLALSELPKLLQNKALIINGHCSVNTLCSSLCSLINDKSLGFPEALNSTPTRFTRSDLQSYVFPAVAALASYHFELESYMQRMVIRSLQSGLVSRSAKICIEGLTLCTLEMRDMMIKLLPSVLLKLSQISATVGVAVSVLEFLSNLIRLPQLYISFVEDQYMSIFAIALPYTNPFKFNQYTVALAHHVIAMWFLKCRIPFRKEFARFITKGLRSSVSVSFEENQNLTSQGVLNEELLQKSASMFSDIGQCETRQSADSTILTLNTELMETCIDLMARFTFGMCSNVPKRSSVASFLLEKGQRSSWMVGNKIITITTSGCGTKAFKYGLCEKCYGSCGEICNKSTGFVSEESRVILPSELEKKQAQPERRRHRSAIQRSTTYIPHDLQFSASHTKDDLLLHRQRLDPQGLNRKRPSSPNECINFMDEDNSENTDKRENGYLCSCWCSGWAEIFIRRPTGNTSWMMKIQNNLFLPSSPPEFPLPVISSLLLPHREEDSNCRSQEEQNWQQYLSDENGDKFQSEDSVLQPTDKVCDNKNDHAESDLYDADNPLSQQISNSSLRRTNSSPDMNTGWTSFDSLVDNGHSEFHSKSTGHEPSVSQEQGVKTDLSEEITDVLLENKEDELEHKVSNISNKNYSKDTPGEYAVKRTRDGLSQQESKANLKLDLNFKTCAINTKDSVAAPHSATPYLFSEKGEFPSDILSRRNSITLKCNNTKDSVAAPHSATPYLFSEKGESPSDILSRRNSSTSSPLFSSFHRDRGHTISVMSPICPRTNENLIKVRNRDINRSGMNPSFVFLQLYHSSCFGSTNQKPLLLFKSEVISRAVRVLDHIPPYDTHKIGVIYVGPGQVQDEVGILSNCYGSVRYVDFLRGLGTLVRLREVDQQSTYVGGLDLKGEDGKFALIWHDDVMQVIFHVATLMPNKKSDPSCNCKKMHIANDFVTIVYNESGEEYSLSTIKGQVTSACVIIRPEDFNSNVVTIKAKSDELIETFGHTDPYIVSDESLPIFVRQVALHANFASLILSRKQSVHDPYVSNWLERLRKIKSLRTKILEEMKLSDENANSEQISGTTFVQDFTDYV